MSLRLHELVSRQAELRPDAVAIAGPRDTLTYGALEAAANRLARALMSGGCRRGDRVCLFTSKSPRAIVGMLATMKAGAAYVPVDISSPAPRVLRIVQSAEPRCILVERSAVKLLDELLALWQPEQPPMIATLEEGALTGRGFTSAFDMGQLASTPDSPVAVEGTGDDLAHILFTSGSTGLPKGVTIAHRNVTAFLDWACPYFGITPSDRTSGHSPLLFDLSTFDIYGTLSRGAQLHLVAPELNLLPARLAAFIRDRQLTQWFSVPSILSYLVRFESIRQDDFPTLERLMWCGEVMPTPTLIALMERLPHVRFTNLYGPTEATIASSYYTVPAIPADPRLSVPIGTGCGGERLVVLDERLQPVADGVIGDLYIAGVGLSPGYWRDAEKTAAAFLTDPADAGERIYKTGDLALTEGGLVHYVGRRDSQIKSRGYRIELGEIETALNSLRYLEECAVVGVDTGGFEGTAICCAYVPAAGGDSTPAAIRTDLSGLIPGYMLPVNWKAYERLPKNANGKIDRPALREAFAREGAMRPAAQQQSEVQQ